jgi:hypothetical protein
MKEEFLLKMGDFKYVFYIWAIGLSVATIAFVAELLCYKHRARIRRNWVENCYGLKSSKGLIMSETN